MKALSRYLAVVIFGISSASLSWAEMVVGPRDEAPSEAEVVEEAGPAYELIPLEVAIPVFDPGLPPDAYTASEKGIWPELRRAEAHRFAWKLKQTIDQSQAFSAARVTPDAQASADLYVLGEIEKSNGEDLQLQIQVIDSTGKRWFSREYDHRVPKYWYHNPRNEGDDPFQSVYDEIVDDLAVYAAKRKDKDIARIQNTTQIRFAEYFAPDSFGHYMKVKNGRVKLVGMPAANDPMVLRTDAIRVRDQVFIDSFQTHYADFVFAMEEPYNAWQKESGNQAAAVRKAKQRAAWQTGLGILAAVGGAVAMGNAGGSYGTYNAGQAAIGATAISAGAVMVTRGMASSQEAKMFKDALLELANSANSEMYPRVVEMKDRTVTLTGTAEEQFAQWRNLLGEIYRAETAPVSSISVVADCDSAVDCQGVQQTIE